MNQGWYAFDLDGTLAHYDGWKGPDNIGEPIAPMVELVKQFLREGKDVRIFTARVYYDPRDIQRVREARTTAEAIYRWCEKHIGQVLPITCHKDFDMISLYDDRCVAVETNTGRILS